MSTVAASAAISGQQVLVVYNSASPDGTALKDHYLAAHPDIPSSNVCDLNNPVLLTPDLPYGFFISLVRDPIRAFINAPGFPDAPDIVAVVLIRPFPHRVYDNTNQVAGDSPTNASNQFGAGDAIFASVDAELVLLWQDLDSGEAGGSMDSHADNMIVNPYRFSPDPIDSFPRGNITTQKTLLANGGVWRLFGSGATRLTAGDLVLVTRIDGNTLSDARAIIDRAQDLVINKARVKLLFDEYDLTIAEDIDDEMLFSTGDPFFGGDDYEEARDAAIADGWTVRYDATFDFITADEEPSPLILYASYGENHKLFGAGADPPGDGTYIVGFDFPRGAIFNTIESYNARGLNGHSTLFQQEQVADFIAAGGTFAVGHVWEPFAFTVPDNEFLVKNFLIARRTWAEAAWTAISSLSWQHVVIGDALAVPMIANDPAPVLGDLDGNGTIDGHDIDDMTELLLDGVAVYVAAHPDLDPYARADFNADGRITPADLTGFEAALLSP